MIIRKMFKFENAHIVRKCSSKRCRESIHGHSYKAEILLESNRLDNGQMVYDFGLTKQLIKDIVDSFDHSVSLWNRDNPAYLLAIREHSSRWVSIPVSPSAEQLSRVLFVLINRIISQTNMINGEENVKLHSIIVHETDTGYAQCFEEDAYNSEMGEIDIEAIQFSKGVQEEWSDRYLHEKLINKILFTNPKNV